MITYSQLLKNNYVGCLTAVFDTQAFGKALMPDIDKRQDYALWLQLVRGGEMVYCLPEIHAKYRVFEGSVSRSKFGLIKYNWRVFRAHERLSVILSSYYLVCNIYNKLAQTGRSLNL